MMSGHWGLVFRAMIDVWVWCLVPICLGVVGVLFIVNIDVWVWWGWCLMQILMSGCGGGGV